MTPGSYALSLAHDRNSNGRFSLSTDGIGFASNPLIALARPSVASASAAVGPQPTRIEITLSYRRGLFAFAPIGR